MGFTFRKSIRLPGGFRINLSKGGVGVSAGVPGFRVGVGSSGAGRVSLGIPGTGLGWVESFRVGGGSKPSAPASLPERGVASAVDAASEAAAFEARIAAITSLHKTSWRTWDWPTVLASAAPPAGTPAHEQWAWLHRIAEGVIAGDVEACDAALHHLGPFASLHELGTAVNTHTSTAWCVEAWLSAHPPEIVPAEEVSVTAAGKASRKKLSATRTWGIYQDHVASVALRLGREIFAVLPIPVALVHVALERLDTRTGHTTHDAILSVAFEREAFLALNFERLDPSDALLGFEHRMDFKKTTGFGAVSVLSPADFDVHGS